MLQFSASAYFSTEEAAHKPKRPDRAEMEE